MAREDDQSVFNEPHLRGRSDLDPSEARADRTLQRADADAQSVFDEPDILDRTAERIDQDWSCSNCGYNLRGLMTDQPCPECGRRELYRPPPPDAPGYARWLSERIAATSSTKSWTITLVLILLGGPWAVFAALLGAEPAGYAASLTLVVLFGPLTEEVLKIGAALVVVETRPYLFRESRQIWLVAFGSAALFAVIENILYLTIYIPNPSLLVTLWRWTACVALHIGCTMIAARGVVAMWQTVHAERRPPQIQRLLPTLLLAVAIHGAYNFAAIILQMSGWLR